MSLRSTLGARSAQTVPRSPPNTKHRFNKSVSVPENGSRRTLSSVHSESEALQLLESVISTLEKKEFQSQCLRDNVIKLNDALKVFGSKLEDNNKNEMDRLMARLGDSFRIAVKEDKMDKVSKYNFMEIIELRSMKWIPNDNLTNYYKQQKLEEAASQPSNANTFQGSISLNVNAPECTPTKTSFANFNPASLNMGDYPNSKFVKSLSFGGKSSSDGFKFEVRIGNETLELCGKNEDLVKSAKLFLESNFHYSAKPKKVQVVRQPSLPGQQKSSFENFSSQERKNNFAKTLIEKQLRDKNAEKPRLVPQNSNTSVKKEVIRYNRNELLDISKLQPELLPKNWPKICQEFPILERKDESLKMPLPYDWDDAFANSKLAVITEMGHNNNNHHSSSNNLVLSSKKKNFLEVLKPDAPIRTWNEEVGEWVEVKETRG